VVLFKSAHDNENGEFYTRFALIESEDGKTEIRGYVRKDDFHYRVIQDPANPSSFTVGSLTEAESRSLLATCGTDHDHSQHATAGVNTRGLRGGLLEIDLATEADYDYYQDEGSSSSTANASILTILNAVDAIYEAELSLTIRVVFQNVWTTASDPYTSSVPTTLLDQFGDYWNDNFSSSVTYDLAHLWTGRDLDGSTIGVAWVGATCSFYRYGLSERRAGLSQDVPLVAHEMGHNVGAGHDATCSSTSWIMCSYLQSNADEFSAAAKASVASHTGSASCLSMVSGSAPTVTLGINNSSIAETGATATVTATLSSTSASAVTVSLGFTGNRC
jgi:hypothetical protein